MAITNPMIQIAFNNPHFKEAVQTGFAHIAENPFDSPLLASVDPNEFYVKACVMPALDYFSQTQDPKKDVMVYFLAYPALEHMDHGAVMKQFGEAVANLNDEIRAFAMEIEGRIPVDHDRTLSPTAKNILNIFALSANPELNGQTDAYVAMSYTSELMRHTPKGRPS